MKTLAFFISLCFPLLAYSQYSGGGGSGSSMYESQQSPLPVILTEFSAKCLDSGVGIQWQTLTESNNECFTVQRSIDAVHWDVIAILPGGGNSNSPLNYQCLDQEPLSSSFYRLVQKDFDGELSFSDAKYIECINSSSAITVFPNPSAEVFFLHGFTQTCGYSVFSPTGVIMKNGTISPEMNSVSLENQPKGVYFLILDADGMQQAVKLLLQ